MYTIKEGENEYKCPDLQTLQRWVDERRVLLDSSVYDHNTMGWRIVSEILSENAYEDPEPDTPPVIPREQDTNLLPTDDDSLNSSGIRKKRVLVITIILFLGIVAVSVIGLLAGNSETEEKRSERPRNSLESLCDIPFFQPAEVVKESMVQNNIIWDRSEGLTYVFLSHPLFKTLSLDFEERNGVQEIRSLILSSTSSSLQSSNLVYDKNEMIKLIGNFGKAINVNPKYDNKKDVFAEDDESIDVSFVVNPPSTNDVSVFYQRGYFPEIRFHFKAGVTRVTSFAGKMKMIDIYDRSKSTRLWKNGCRYFSAYKFKRD